MITLSKGTWTRLTFLNWKGLLFLLPIFAT